MEYISCRVVDQKSDMPSGAAGHLCDRVSETIGGRRIDPTDTASIVSGKTPSEKTDRLHVLEATVISPQTIAMRYSIGSIAAWQAGEERHFDDLRVDIVDSVINDTVISMVADTVRRLAGDN